MRITLRLMGLDLLDLCIETDASDADVDNPQRLDGDPGDCTTSAVGFSLPEHPAEFTVPDRGWGE